ncbi:MAG: RNA-binding S4 domain-containing protein, partial [Mesorhizobium sp.]
NRDKAAQASDLVKPGDVLTITLDRRIFVWKVLGAGVRRGPAEEARTLYEDMSPLPTPKADSVPDAIPALREAGSGRPTKRERRQTDRLLGED